MRKAEAKRDVEQIAALQLDMINVDAGNGHRHVQFQQGAAPDGEPDGSGRRTP
ncbi:hypothetical protein [Actinokineospora sp.]|uniref:hypothetical protein n=1 Tax=Actinokineospora sp. TaxID=1872133 RepID=UPI003D6C0E1F